jgi:hypothetical protein
MLQNMVIGFFLLTVPIHWRLHANDPKTFTLAETDNWLLVNPLYYPQRHRAANQMEEVEEGKFVCYSKELVFISSDAPAGTMKIFEELDLVVDKLLIKIRHISGQATLPLKTDIGMHGTEEVNELPELTRDYLPLYKQFKTGSVSHYYWTTSVTSQVMERGLSLGCDFTPHMREVMYLDAFKALNSGEYRTAIIYSAVSTEVALNSAVDDAYQRAKSAEKDDVFRIITLEQAKGEQVRKDPIFEGLRQRFDAAKLLHEIPLYALRRSLMVEDHELYTRVRSLYETRNSLLHSGRQHTKFSLLSLNREGAATGIKTAHDLFEWLGIKDDLPLPKNKMVDYPAVTW